MNSVRRHLLPARFALVVAIAIAGTACHPLTFQPTLSPPPVAPSGSFRAGAAIADMTPPAGFSTWGHGPDALPSRGHRGRVRCRVIYLEDAQGERTALVPCDFAAISVSLQREVAERTATSVGIGVDRLVLSATHTHGGPGNYFAAFNYHRGISSEPAGYDAALVDFLVDRLVAAIERAHANAIPARIAWATAFINGNGSTERSIGVNRSLDAHCENTAPMGSAPTTCAGPTRNANSEVEGRLDLLRIDAADGSRPIGLFASFPVHGTVVPHSNAFFEADLWGFAARYLEAHLATAGQTFVAALANGPEGDVRPNYQEQSWDEARRLGELLGARIEAVYGTTTSWEATPRIATAYLDLELRGAIAPNRPPTVRTCDRPEFGAVAPGGSEEGRTTGFVHRIWEPEGTTDDDRNSCHAPGVRVPFARIASHNYPDVAPLVTVGIGSATLLAYPWEMTTTAAIRMRQRIQTIVGASAPVVFVGLANEYVQYLTTPEEFREQHYEGASVLYGENTLEVVTQHFERLVAAMRAGQTSNTRSVDAIPIRIGRTDPDEVAELTGRALEPTIDVDASGAIRFESHDAFVVTFRAGPPGSLTYDGTAIARVEHRDASGTYVPLTTTHGVPIDDTHEDVLFEYLGRARRERDRYRVVWIPAEGTAAGDYRIAVADGTGAFVAGPSMSFRGRP